MKYKKVFWSKMHQENYNGSCKYCGGECTDKISRREWQKAIDNLKLAEIEATYGDLKKLKYYRKKIQSKQTFTFHQ